MLSRETEERVRKHLRLARGLLETTALVEASSEFEERNALSRAYYAVLHACNALLLSHGMEPSKSHGGVNKQIGRWRGRDFAQFMANIYRLRIYADYDPLWIPVRHVNDSNLNTVWTNVLWACAEAEQKLKSLL
jgi:uncharacterized protein (UPF0332 family)